MTWDSPLGPRVLDEYEEVLLGRALHDLHKEIYDQHHKYVPLKVPQFDKLDALTKMVVLEQVEKLLTEETKINTGSIPKKAVTALFRFIMRKIESGDDEYYDALFNAALSSGWKLASIEDDNAMTEMLSHVVNRVLH